MGPKRVLHFFFTEMMWWRRLFLLHALGVSWIITADSSSEARELIVNGEDAKPGEFPFFAFMKLQRAGCGASLIWTDILLTAAHCQSVFDGRGAFVGGYADFGEVGGEFHEDDSVVRHPEFNYRDWHNDIMLVKLQTPSSMPIVEIAREQPAEGDPLVVIGHGYTEENGVASPTLQKVSLTVASFTSCAYYYANSPEGEPAELNQTVQLCAWDRDGASNETKDACVGDSGGPALWNGKVVGLTSFGQGCGRPLVPTVYTRVDTLVDWVDKKICELSSDPPSRCASTVLPSPSSPSFSPTLDPVPSPPTVSPTVVLSVSPTTLPSSKPSLFYSASPTAMLSASPSTLPSSKPSVLATTSPTDVPSQSKVEEGNKKFDSLTLSFVATLAGIVFVGSFVWASLYAFVLSRIMTKRQNRSDEEPQQLECASPEHTEDDV